MVIHECKICLKQFKRRVDLVYHTENKKKPCQAKNTQIHTTSTQDPHISTQNHTKNVEKLEEPKNDKETIKDDQKVLHSCIYCSMSFTRKDALKRHIDKYCKVKILIMNTKRKHLNYLLKRKIMKLSTLKKN